jgi:hypothetical protein
VGILLFSITCILEEVRPGLDIKLIIWSCGRRDRLVRGLSSHKYIASAETISTKQVAGAGAHLEFFTGGVGGGPEATYNLCLVLKTVL